MKFYRSNNQIYDIRPEDSSTQRVVHCGENVLNLTFRTPTPLDFRINDYVVFDDEKYKLKSLVNPTRRSSREFEYNMQLMSPQYDFEDALYTLEDETGAGVLDDDVPLFGTAIFHLMQIVKCVKRVHPEWAVGQDVLEETGEAEAMNISYSEMNCLEALQHLCAQFNLEYWFSGATVSIGQKYVHTPTTGASDLVFKYGKGNALYDLTRQNQDGRIVTKLLVKGSDRNIDSSAYGSKRLLLPGGARYVERNIDKFGVIMGRKYFDDVYPRMIHANPTDPGSVTAVRVDANGIYWIKDSKLDFEPEMLPGKNIIVNFQSGQLGGLQIDANWHSDTKEFELIRGDYGMGMDLPASIFVPAVGDKYFLFDIKMPQAYINAAERELLAKAEEAIAQMCEQKVSYKGQVNPLFFRALGQRITTGRAVVVEDDAIVASPDGGNSVELRIQAFTRSVNDDLSIDIEISDTLYISRISRIEGDVREIKNDANERIDLSTSYTRRRWRDVQETMAMMFDPEGDYFSEMIKPLIVQTAQLIVGTNSQQFDFRGVRFKPNYNNNPNDFRWDAGYLDHFTIDPSGVKRTWNISAGAFTGSSGFAYYVYARCNKTTNVGEIYLSTGKLSFEDTTFPNFYHFWVGVLNMPIDGYRSWQPMHGYTEITGNQIVTGVIRDAGNNLVINLANGTITGYGRITDKPDLSGYATTSQLQVLSNSISATVTTIYTDLNAVAGNANNIGARVTTLEQAGFITTAQGNTLFATKTEYNILNQKVVEDHATLVLMPNQITSTVSSMLNGTEIVSRINQTASTVTIDAQHINLNGAITANQYFKINTDGSFEAKQGTIGYFSVNAGILKSERNSSDSIQAIIIRNYAYNTELLIGDDVIPGQGGGSITCTASIINGKQGANESRALYLQAAGSAPDFSGTHYPMALVAKGSVRITGGLVAAEAIARSDTYNAIAESNGTIPSLQRLLNYSTFAYNVSSPLTVYLPTGVALGNLFGSFADGAGFNPAGMLRIRIMCIRPSSSYIRVQVGGSGTDLLNKNGSVISYHTLTVGMVVELIYWNYAWYTASANWNT